MRFILVFSLVFIVGCVTTAPIKDRTDVHSFKAGAFKVDLESNKNYESVFQCFVTFKYRDPAIRYFGSSTFFRATKIYPHKGLAVWTVTVGNYYYVFIEFARTQAGGSYVKIYAGQKQLDPAGAIDPSDIVIESLKADVAACI